MHITLRRSGGFAAVPGLQRPVEVDTAALPADEAAALEGLVHSSGVLDAAEPGSSVPDARRYEITVTDGDTRRTAVVADPLPSDEISELVSRLERYRRRT